MAPPFSTMCARCFLISDVSNFCVSAICAVCPIRGLNENRVEMDVYQIRTIVGKVGRILDVY